MLGVLLSTSLGGQTMRRSWFFGVFLSALLSLLPSSIAAQTSWGPQVELTSNVISNLGTHAVAASICGGDCLVSVTWEDASDQIIYRRSTNCGDTWDSQLFVAGNGFVPSIAASSIQGEDIRILFESGNNLADAESGGSAECGIGFPFINDPVVDSPVNPGQPDIATHGIQTSPYDDVHMVWTENLHELWYDYRVTQDKTDRRLYSSGSTIFAPQIAVNGSDLIGVIWHDSPEGSIYFMRSTNHGGSWSSAYKLADVSSSLLESSISIKGDVVHVVWADWESGQMDIFYRRSTNGGASWGSVVNLSSDPADQAMPHIVVSDDVHVVWSDKRNGDWEAYYTRSTNEGVSWLGSERVTSSGTSTQASLSAIEIDGTGYVHVVWRGGDGKIWYRQGTYGGAVGVDDDQENTKTALPMAFSLSQNYPNPFNPSTTVTFDVPVAAGSQQRITVTVYDLRGRRIRTLVDSRLEPGSHQVTWDGRDDRGETVDSGVFLCALQSAEGVVTRKMLLLK
jgi:hypothetical protein